MVATNLNFDWGFTDAQIEVTPEWYAPAWPLMAATQPAFWRLVIDWQVTAVTMNAGPFQNGAKSPITATITGSGHVGNPHINGQLDARATATGTGVVVGVAPSAQGRNWAWIDGVLNDMRLQTNGTMDIVMVIGQAAPNGWTNADFKKFAAECVVRYGPGGQGVRTDGPYATINAGWGVRYWEIWNEQNNSIYWGQTVNPAQYTSFLQAGYQGIKSIAPSTPAPGTRPTGNQSVVIFGGMQHEPFSGVQFGYGFFGFDEVSFLQKCYAAAIAMGTTLGTMFDSMATHVYTYGDFAYGSGPGQQFPSNLISSMNFPAVNTSAQLQVTARASGSGAINATPGQTGRLNVTANATGFGTLNNYEPSGDYNSPTGGLPTMFMDNMRQLQGVYALMVANGDGAKKIKITECGYGVYRAGWTPDLQNRAMQALFALFNTLPYIDMVLIYNAIDANSSKTDDGFTGFGALAYDRTPRPLYNWLLTLAVLAGGSAPAVVTATATGSGSIASTAALTITTTATGTGLVRGSGGVIVATITGSGAAVTNAVGAPVITVVAHGAGVKAIFSGGPGTSGALTVAMAASGIGRVGVQPRSNGDLLVRLSASGAGRVGNPSQAASVIIATALGDGVISLLPGQEIGVVGEVTGGTPVFTATAAGAGAVISGSSGALTATAAAVGVGVVGVRGSGTSTITFTGTTGSFVGPVGTGTLSVSAAAAGNGLAARFGAGSLTVTVTPGQTETLTYFDMGAQTITATAVGAGIVGKVGSGTQTITSTPTSGGIKVTGGGASSITATGTGAGSVNISGGGVSLITIAAIGGGAGSFSMTGVPLSVTATATGAGVVAESITGVPLSVSATATGAGAVTENAGGTPSIAATAIGAGVVAEFTGGVSIITATALGVGVVAMSTTGVALSVTATGLGAGVKTTAPVKAKPKIIRVYTGHRLR